MRCKSNTLFWMCKLLAAKKRGFTNQVYWQSPSFANYLIAQNIKLQQFLETTEKLLGLGHREA